MRYLWLWGSLLITAVRIAAQPPVHLSGTLKGWFVTPQGELKVYEVPFSFPEKPSNLALPNLLYPVWAKYYLRLQGKFVGAKAQSVQLLSGKGETIYDGSLKETEFSIPTHQTDWLSIHAKVGLDFRLILKFADGTRQTISPYFATKLGALQELKIDWRDLVRIAEVRKFLKEEGDKIFPGLRADDVPFLLEGDERQGVLVGGKFPEKWRFKGVVPNNLPVYILPFPIRVPPEVKKKILGAIVQIPSGVVAFLTYKPGWDELQEMDEPNPHEYSERLLTILHEAVHYWVGQTLGWRERPKPFPCTDLEGFLAWKLEGNALARALSAEENEERIEAIRDFLRFRWYRRQLGCGKPKEEQEAEWTEGFAALLTEQALKMGMERWGVPILYEPALFFLELEPFEKPQALFTLPFELLSDKAIRDFGYAQAKVLEKVMPDWKKRGLYPSLEELLAEAVGLSFEKVASLPEHQIRREIRERAIAVGFAKPFERESQEAFEVVALAPMRKDKSSKFAEGLAWVGFERGEATIGNLQMKSQRELGVAQVHQKDRNVLVFRWLSPPAEQWIACQEDERIEVRGRQVSITVRRGEVWSARRGVAIGTSDLVKGWVEAYAENLQDATPLKLGKVWTVLTTAALTAFGGAAQGQDVVVTGSISGYFLNTSTDTVEYHTIEFVSSPEPCQYSTLEPIDEETYEVVVQAFDPEGQMVRLSLVLKDGKEVTVTSKQPTNRLVLVYRGKWAKILRPIGELVEWFGQVTLKVAKKTGEEVVEKALRKFLTIWLQGKKKGNLAIFVHIGDAEQKTASSFTSTYLEVWRGNKRVLPPPEASWVIYTDDQGMPVLEAPDYVVRAKKFSPILACPEVWSLPVKVEEGQTTQVTLLFLYHKGIVGRVVDQNGNPLANARAYLYKDDIQLSDACYSDPQGYFTIPALHIDTALAKYGSGTYTIKVIPPPRSPMQPDPKEALKEVTLTKCEQPKSGECPRAFTVNVGEFVFTYKPPTQPPGQPFTPPEPPEEEPE